MSGCGEQPRLVRAARIISGVQDDPVLEDAALYIEHGRIAGIAPWKRLRARSQVLDLRPQTLVPGLINSHCHLELAHLQGKIRSGSGFLQWADQLFAQPRSFDPFAVKKAARFLRDTGVCAVADVRDGRIPEISDLALGQGVQPLWFPEFSGNLPRRGFAACSPSTRGVALHSLYAASAELAQGLKDWSRQQACPFSLHLAEVPGENALFCTDKGPFAEFVRSRKILPKGFVCPGESVTAYADRLGLLDARTLAVHCVHADDADVVILAERGSLVCLCLQSNGFIGTGHPPVSALLAANIPICLGTDSLASVATLDLWQELRSLRAYAPELSGEALLQTVTAIPARFFGLEEELGTLEVGRKARWAVLPEDMLSWFGGGSA